MERARGSKRLRGWRLEMTIEDPCQKGEDMELDGDELKIPCAPGLSNCGAKASCQASEICHLALLSVAKCGR